MAVAPVNLFDVTIPLGGVPKSGVAPVEGAMEPLAGWKMDSAQMVPETVFGTNAIFLSRVPCVPSGVPS